MSSVGWQWKDFCIYLNYPINTCGKLTFHSAETKQSAIEIVKTLGENKNTALQISDDSTPHFPFAPRNLDFLCISGSIYTMLIHEVEQIEQVFENALTKRDFSGFSNIVGDYIFSFGRNDTVIVFNGIGSQYDFFWNLKNGRFNGSTYHDFVVKTDDIDRNNLPLLCYGHGVNIYNNLNILSRNCALLIEGKHCIVKNQAQPIKNILPTHSTLEEISEVLYGSLKTHIGHIISGKSKCALLLSGGIDSSVLARCLYDCNVNVDFYTWSTRNQIISDSSFSSQVAAMFGNKLNALLVDEEPYGNLYPRHPANVFPYFNPLSSWMEAAIILAKEAGNDMIMTGCFAESIRGSSMIQRLEPSLVASVSFWDVLGAIGGIGRYIHKKTSRSPRKMDFFTLEAKTIIDNSTSPKIGAQMYSYKVNLMDYYRVELCSPFLNHDYTSLSRYMPKRYSNYHYAGFEINKVALRYAMLDKLPHSVVSRCYPSNTNHMIARSFLPKANELLRDFTTDSYLVRNGIVDLEKIQQALRIHDINTFDKNKTTLCPLLLIEKWLSAFENEEKT